MLAQLNINLLNANTCLNNIFKDKKISIKLFIKKIPWKQMFLILYFTVVD